MSDNKLGRGLSELMVENMLDISNDEQVRELDIDKIQPNPDQPRSIFNKEALLELSNSIKEHGVIQPIIVKASGDHYILVAGERRLKASELLGLSTVPAIVREYNSIYLAELALLENLQREDLSSIEEALALQKLQIMNEITHEELGIKIGKSRSYVTNAIGLLKLPSQIIEDVNQGVLTSGHARSLSKLKDVKLIMELRNRVIAEELTVRDLENIIKTLKKGHEPHVSKEILKKAKLDVKSIFKNDANVSVSSKSISFKFSSEEELEKLLLIFKSFRRK